MSRPYHDHAPEIEAVRKAIDACGRPMVLSLSPGETPLDAADHVQRHANLWRISDDFWDQWPLLLEQFGRLERWNRHRLPGCWPDADMLPLGVLDLGKRTTRFTPDEQRTMMTLWSIGRSPLIMGGDLRKLDPATTALLTNDEVLAVNQRSTGNRPLVNAGGTVVWTAEVPGSKARYVALFNISDGEMAASVDLGQLGVKGRVSVRDLWARKDDGVAEVRLERTLPAHGAGLYRLG
jgi:alpha-galactosidase